MIDFPYIDDICQPTASKIVMLVVDGLGGLADPKLGKSELEIAKTPNLDALSSRSSTGLTVPVMPGITPGSGPGHLSLFGYDPVKYLVGRGVLEALGINIGMNAGDVAARGNFCTLDVNGMLVDRRAGRIDSSESTPLCDMLDKIVIDGLDVSIFPVKDYRFVALFKGDGLDENLTGTDPQELGVPPSKVQALSAHAIKTADSVNLLIEKAEEVLGNRKTANMILLRGFSMLPTLPDFGQTYKLNPCAIAAYPMYRGLAKILGMSVIPTGTTFTDEINTLRGNFDKHDFFYLHYKPADAAGEDGDFYGKVQSLEELDSFIPQILELNPDVLVIAGDHSSPAVVAGHGWQPVPLLINSEFTLGEGVSDFSEKAFGYGSLGRLQATNVMFLALAHARKLLKFGP